MAIILWPTILNSMSDSPSTRYISMCSVEKYRMNQYIEFIDDCIKCMHVHSITYEVYNINPFISGASQCNGLTLTDLDNTAIF